MKKNLIFAFVAIAAFASCSSSDDMVADNNGINEAQNPQINLTVSASKSIIGTRGTGMVGAVGDTEANVWNGEGMNIYMLQRGTMDYAYFNKQMEEAETPIFGNATTNLGTAFDAPVSLQTGIATPADKSIKYFPTTGNYDFWGYRIDDAELTDEVVKTDEAIILPIKIDGSQDVMVGKALPTQDQQTNPEVLDRIYSAYSARNGVQPVIDFHHILTRLTFQVEAANESVCDPATGVYIDSIKVLTKDNAELVVAYTDAAGIMHYNDQITFVGDETELFIKSAEKDLDGKLKPLQPVLPTWDAVENKSNLEPIGESLMVPAQSEYKLRFCVRQTMPTSSVSSDTEVIKYDMPYTLVNKPEGAAEALPSFYAGYSYNVRLKIFGLKDIKITTSLENWKDGQTIPIIPEDEEY